MPKTAAPEGTFEERVHVVAKRDQTNIRWRGPTHDIPVRDAEHLLRRELLPAAVAVARRAGSLATDGATVIEIHDDCAVVLMTRAPEQMTAEAAGAALKDIEALRRRLRRTSTPKRQRRA